MTAVVGAAASVLHSASSADFSARRFPPNIASHVSFQSTPFSFLCSSGFPALRKSGRRRTRRVVEVREGSSFVSLVSKELANNGNEEFGGRQSASGRNARFTRASMQEESFRSRSSILAKNEGKLPWVLHTQQARRVEASSMYHSRGSKFSKSADTPESYNRNERHHKQAFPKKIRSSPDGQRYHSLSVGKKYPKAPLLTENQQSRLHNKVTIFEGITEPRSSDYNDAHQCSLPVDVDDGFSNIKEQDANLNMEILDHRHNSQKGKLFMLKLEGEMSILRTAEGSHDLKRGGEEARRKEAPFGRTEGKEVQRKGTITNVLDGQNAHDIIQPNTRERSSGNKLQKPTVSANWHKHEIPNLPFEFQFSYSETPQKPILRYRGHPFSPFGPSSMKRPWIGDRPNNPSKKKPWVFDSFHPPPRDLKGVKHVQDPGPYPVGQGPKAANSREEIMGEPLTKEEIVYLVEKCQRETRQLNLGRDGLTHNMLDLIHSHWKRRRVCRIKCKGVPTVDMDNVKLHVEDKTGGKIIYQAGGVLYLFRGRNYNYRDRPYIPLMLWKPATPVYPKLIQDPPEGLTIEEAYRLRKLGLKVEPICKLGKNGVYMTLVDDVRAAFKVDELVRVDCEGLNPSDYKKIGAKLRDLVPCVLLSFDKEHILMWKGKQETTVEGTSMLQAPELEAMAGNTCNGAEHYDLNISEGDEKAFEPPPRAQDPCEVGEAGGLLASPNCLAIDREDNEGQVDVLSTSVGLATSKEQFDEENSIRSNYVVDIDALWEHAFQSGMAIELSEGDMDSDLIVRKADELVQSAPLAPKYTIRLMYKYQMKRDPDYKPSDELQIHFGRVVTQRPKKEVKRKFQLPTVGVPGMGGLPVDELAKLLVRK